MSIENLSPARSLLVLVLFPVVAFSAIITTLAVRSESTLLNRWLLRDHDAFIVLAADLSGEICEKQLTYLLEFRFEMDSDIVESVRLDTIAQVLNVSSRFEKVEMAIVDVDGTVLGDTSKQGLDRVDVEWSLREDPERLHLGGVSAVAAHRLAPYFRWYTVAYMPMSTYRAPVDLVNQAVALGAGITVGLTILSFVVAFIIVVRRPLISLASAAGEVEKGSYGEIGTRRRDEIGRAIATFDSMVRALKSKDTEMEALVRRLESSQERFRSAFHTSPDAISISNYIDAVFIEVNQGFCLTSGFNSAEIVGRTPGEIGLLSEYDNFEVRRRLDAFGVVSNMPLEIRTKNGQLRSILYSARVTDLEEGQVVVGVGRDITEIKKARHESEQLQEQLFQAQKMEAVGRLAGGVAHDMNNIMTAIEGFGYLLEQNLEHDTEEHAWIEEVLKAGDRASSLTRQLLIFSRRENFEAKNILPGELVLGLGGMLRRLIGEDIELNFDVGAASWMVRVDPNQLEHAVVNLVVNARDAMPRGGTLTIRARNETRLGNDAAESGVFERQDIVHIEVEDSGDGMDAKTLEHAFEPFFSTKHRESGTGLGLSTVHSVVSRSGGRVWAESAKGAGTTIHIELPRIEASTEPAVEQERGSPCDTVDMGSDGGGNGRKVPPRGNETILIVEDEDAVRNLAAIALMSLGYRVIPAATGEEAIAIVDTVDAQCIDLLLTDVIMPIVDGIAVADHLSSRIEGLGVLFMTGYAQDILKMRGVTDTDIEILRKPFTPAELAIRVRSVLDARIVPEIRDN